MYTIVLLMSNIFSEGKVQVRLGVLLMHGNSALILNRTPRHADPEVDGDQDFDN